MADEMGKGNNAPIGNRRTVVIFLCIYLAFVFYITLLSREVQPDYVYRLKAFRTLKRTIKIDIGFSEILELLFTRGLKAAAEHISIRWKKIRFEVPGNILLFLPIGYMVSMLADRHFRFLKTLLSGLLLSLAIESTQLIFRIGWFDIDDLIHNTFGTLTGWGIFKIYEGIQHFRRFHNRSARDSCIGRHRINSSSERDSETGSCSDEKDIRGS